MRKNINSKTNVIVAGWIGSENMGDEAIFSSLIQSVQNLPIEITAFTINEEKTRQLYNIKTAPFEIFNHPTRFLKAIWDSDLMLVGGGGILQDQTSIFNIWRYLYKAILAKALGKKVMFYAVGAGPINFRINRFLVRLVLNGTDAITVRDSESLILLERLGVKRHLINISFDPAITLTTPDENLMREILKKEVGERNKKKIIGVSLRHWFDTHPFLPVSIAQKLKFKNKGGKEKYNDFISQVANSLDEINKDGEFEILFLPFWHSRDSHVHQDVVNNLKRRSSVHMLSREYTPSQLLGLFTCVDYVLGMRLHSCIFSANVGVPFIALSYTSKVKNFLDELGAGELMVKIDNFKSHELVSKFKVLQNNQKEISEKIIKAASIARQKEDINTNILKSLIIDTQSR